MGKKLSTQTKLKRLRAEGYSRKELAKAFGVSVSSIGRAERGAKGTTIEAQVSQFYKLGKRARANVISGQAALPSAKPAPEKKEPKKEKALPEYVDAFTRAEGHLSVLPGDMTVVVTVIFLDDSARVFWPRGGIEVSKIRGRLKAALREQGLRQGRGNEGSISDPKIDFDQIKSIEVKEY